MNFSFNNWLTYIIPRTVLKTSSRFNPDIRVNVESGAYKLLVNGSRESGTYIAELWQYAMEHLHVTSDLPIKQILVLGVAGGTVIHMLHDTFPMAKIIGVDIDPVMLDIGKKYFGLGLIKKLTLMNQDAQAFVMKKIPKYDLVVLDVFIGREIPAFASSEKFLQSVKRMITPGGRLFINFLREDEYGAKAEILASRLRLLFADVRSADRFNNRFFLAQK